MKVIHWIILTIVLAIGAVFAFLYPANAFYNKKTGTLRLSARFRSKSYPLKDYMGKTASEIKGNVVFDVDYLTQGVIKYVIVNKTNNAVLIRGEVRYKYSDILQYGLPVNVSGASGSTSESDRPIRGGGGGRVAGTCGCKH